jgi:DNA-binding XRE family transcriptional regulator
MRLSLRELAQITGLSKTTIADVEAGRRHPSLRVALTLSHALHRPIEQLFPDVVQATEAAKAAEAP